MLELTRQGDVFLLRLDAGENRFTPELVAEASRALDQVEEAGAPKALVTTGSGHFYSNGLDLSYLVGAERRAADAYLASVLDLMARVLVFPAFTVAAVNGHAFGAGGQLALAHDLRVMRTGRGYLCMPEIDMGASLHPGMTALLEARLPPQTAHEMIVTGRRYPAEEALARGIVEHAVPEAEVVPRALALAAELAAKAKPAMAQLKRGLYAPVLEALRIPLSQALAAL